MSSLAQLALRRAVVGDGIEIHHVEAGVGPALVFVHGGMGDWLSWEPQWEAFTQRFRCISYSRRHSFPNRNALTCGDHSVRKEAADLVALLAHWDAQPAILVGTSYGAYTALWAAIAHPEKVRALALTEPPVLPLADRVPGGREARLQFEREVLAPSDEDFRAGRPGRAVELLTTGINGRAPGEATTPAGLARRLRNAEAMHALALSSDPYPTVDADALAALRVPTLLLRGERTMPVHRATFAALTELMPRAHTHTVPGCGHGVHRDNPEAFNTLVLEFLRELQ